MAAVKRSWFAHLNRLAQFAYSIGLYTAKGKLIERPNRKCVVEGIVLVFVMRGVGRKRLRISGVGDGTEVLCVGYVLTASRVSTVVLMSTVAGASHSR